jgi:hypothetical protein
MKKHESHEKKKKFIELRGIKSFSFDRISKELNVSKNTLLKWSHEFNSEIKNLKNQELENLIADYRVTYNGRQETLFILYKKIKEELNKRDLSDMPTHKLFEVFQKIHPLISSEVEFEVERDEVGSSWLQFKKKFCVKV